MSLPSRPKPVVDPLHGSITSEQIACLVNQFYASVRADERLGGVFGAHVSDWGRHLERMTLFWESVLLRRGGYKGQPMVAHKALDGVQSTDFQIWLTLFRAQVEKTFDADAVPAVMNVTERIAQSLWLGMFGNPFETPPAWLSSHVENGKDIKR